MAALVDQTPTKAEDMANLFAPDAAGEASNGDTTMFVADKVSYLSSLLLPIHTFV